MSVLADTSVWIDHFRSENPRFVNLLNNGEVLIHPMVIGKLACGNLRNRSATLEILNELPAIRVIEYGDILDLIDYNRLMGKGIDYVDVHLLASVDMDGSALLWTLDRRLRDAAAELSIGYTPEQERRTIL
ncbi:MAG: type II toxin-antitoxin system VapC family toxin [Chloroflexi bacterium]|nr:type II toxin-antitoxin system VapC family toxin [Chloroflexota bacterium]